MKLYKAIILDLDRTIWDFDKNSRTALKRIFYRNQLMKLGLEEIEFADYYANVNESLWSQYRKGDILHSDIRSRRFEDVLLNFGVVDRDLAFKINREYINECPRMGELFIGVKEWLEKRKEQGLKLYVASNGIQDIQEIKLKSTGVFDLFEGVYCSDRVGAIKPDKAFFDYILESIDIPVYDLCYIGDELEVDGKAAEAVGMDFYLVKNGKLNELDL